MTQARHRNIVVLGGLCALAVAATSQKAFADAGGAGFWLPGIFGSLAAVPGVPGWAYSTIYLHLQANAGAAQNFVTSGGVRGSVVAGLNAHADALALGITYTSATPVLGGQAAVTLLTAPGNAGVGINASLTGPLGNTISGVKTDNRTTLSDVYYQGTLKWNQGVNNEMVYITGNIPSGTYDPNRLANLNLGFVAYDVGGGYTYFDQKTGHEFSVVGGFTYNLMNPFLQYQNGVDFHLDWAASQFVSKNDRSGWPAISISRSRETADPARRSARSSGARSASAPRSASSSPSPRSIRAISTSKDTRTWRSKTGPTRGARGSPSRSRRRRLKRHRRSP